VHGRRPPISSLPRSRQLAGGGDNALAAGGCGGARAAATTQEAATAQGSAASVTSMVAHAQEGRGNAPEAAATAGAVAGG